MNLAGFTCPHMILGILPLLWPSLKAGKGAAYASVFEETQEREEGQ